MSFKNTHRALQIQDDYRPSSAASRIRGALREIRWLIISGVALVLTLTLLAPFLPHPASQILAGILTAGLTTLLSIFATYHASGQASERGAKEELTRYGLLAWRNLDSLQLKIAEQLRPDCRVSREALQEWNLDVDQAKWAWRDLLREVFELEERLQNETFELAQEYRQKIRAAPSAEEARKLEAEQSRDLARLTSSSRLPIRIPADVRCPYCSDIVNVLIGSNPGDTAIPVCPSCERRFFAHRGGEGSLFTRQQRESQITSPLKYVTPEAHLQSLKAVAAVFGATEDNWLPDWPSFFARVSSRLQEAGVDPVGTSAVQRWLFHLKAFRLYGPGKGIGLVVSPDSLVDFVEQRVVSRLNGDMAPESLCEVLYGSRKERVGALSQLLTAARSSRLQDQDGSGLREAEAGGPLRSCPGDIG